MSSLSNTIHNLKIRVRKRERIEKYLIFVRNMGRLKKSIKVCPLYKDILFVYLPVFITNFQIGLE